MGQILTGHSWVVPNVLPPDDVPGSSRQVQTTAVSLAAATGVALRGAVQGRAGWPD